jgi:hypothetical protein
MSEEQNTNEPTEETPATESAPATGEPEKTYTQADLDRKMNQMAMTIKGYKERDEKAAEDAKKAEEQRALKKGELEKVITSKDETISELNTRIQAIELEAQKSKLDSKLIAAGIVDPMARVGWTATYFAQEEKGDVDAWIAAQQEKSPGSFKAPKVTVGTNPVGGVSASGSNDSLESRLKSEDVNIRRAANKERFRKTLSGEIQG